MLGCCCALLSPCWADVEPLCLGTAFVSCAVWVVVVSWLRMVSLRRVNNVLGVYWCCVTCHLVVPWWSVGDVLVQTSRPISLYCAGASWWRLGGHAFVMLRLRGILQVLRWHLSGAFGGVWVVSCLWVSWW